MPIQIGYNRRFDAGFVAAQAAVQGGALGKLHTVRSTTWTRLPPPPAYIAASSGIFRLLGARLRHHPVVTGREVTGVYAVGGNAAPTSSEDAGDADTTGAILTLDDGTIAVVSSSRHNARGYDGTHGDPRFRGLHRRRPWRTSCRFARSSPA